MTIETPDGSRIYKNQTRKKPFLIWIASWLKTATYP